MPNLSKHLNKKVFTLLSSLVNVGFCYYEGLHNCQEPPTLLIKPDGSEHDPDFSSGEVKRTAGQQLQKSTDKRFQTRQIVNITVTDHSH